MIYIYIKILFYVHILKNLPKNQMVRFKLKICDAITKKWNLMINICSKIHLLFAIFIMKNYVLKWITLGSQRIPSINSLCACIWKSKNIE